MLKILLSGCNGRMGQAITNLCREDEDVVITAGLDQNAVKLADYPVYADLMEYGGTADVLVDFSNASALEGLLAYGLEHKIPLVLATTGYSEDQLKAVAKAAERIPEIGRAHV